jgi:hypothetical protein
MEFPSVVETNNGSQKESRPSSPSITSGITGMSLSTSAQGGPSYASVTAQQTPDPDMLEFNNNSSNKQQYRWIQTPLQPVLHQIL